MQYEKYTLIPDGLFNSLNQLSGRSFSVYVLLRSKLRYRKGSMVPVDRVVTCTYREVDGAGLHRGVFSRGIKQLIREGLIEIEERGDFGGRRPTRYRILG